MIFKSIFITGGVLSSLGKGLTAASLALLLKQAGHRVALLKLDPYLNVDSGTMNPYEHGEVYVTEDGMETDLDLGHYYRYTGLPLGQHSIATAGSIYASVLGKERKGDYLGCTIQIIPHITHEIKQRIIACAHTANAEIVLVEIGGTVGDMESLSFLEAIRQFCLERADSCFKIHMTYIPYLKAAGELKTKPTQHSAQTLRSIGIIPDMIICRSEKPLNHDIRKKIGLFCNVSVDAVFELLDVKHSIYEIPVLLRDQNILNVICKSLNIPHLAIQLPEWETLIYKLKNLTHNIRIGIVGKYLKHQDAYKSVFEALNHASIHLGSKIEIVTIDADDDAMENLLKTCHGCLVPGGFGPRGWEGKLKAVKWCRENNLPFFGICFGMQAMAVEFARHVLKLNNANSTEIDNTTPYPVICLEAEQVGISDLGGSMRLGNYNCILKPQSKAFKAYQTNTITERHRHRYEVNQNFVSLFEEHGLNISGTHLINDNTTLCEILEYPNHPWMVGVQFHPEFLSQPTAPHPLFTEFIKASIAYFNEEKNL
ncbi:CTP synthase [Candidatus Clavichlamydia salmonicola]|uniref:CTP synthase n=1 Tax=Candidatus Clavichlamydia salmonicola TaxID=469812 RepID=UPI00189124D5|nr:CTP synthase [Candidatus Clavichlamydia salmonicola]MBF5050828.1 CTP synthase [Candidatus Clavichlamydia salmonicola]